MVKQPASVEQAVVHFRTGRLSEAENLCRQVLEHNSRDPEALHLLGVLAQKAGHYEEAVKLLRNALEYSPSASHIYNSMAGALAVSGQYDEAIDVYRKALLLTPDSPELHFNLGNLYQHCRKIPDSVSEYRQALELKPDFVAALNNLGNALQQSGRLADAAECYQRMLLLDAQDVRACCNLAMVRRKSHEHAAALEYYEKALCLNPDLVDAHQGMGMALQEMGRLPEALDAYNRVLKLQAENVDALFCMGNTLFLQRKWAEAVGNYRKALSIKPGFAEAHNNLGNLLREMGEMDEAETCFRRALSLKPELTDAYCSQLDLLTFIGDVDGAEELCDGLLERIEKSRKDNKLYEFSGMIFLLPYLSINQKIAMEIAADYEKQKLPAVKQPAFLKQKSKNKLRIGYVSPNFGNHPVGHVMRGVYRRHDRNVIEVTTYSLQDRSGDSGDYSRAARNESDNFVDLSGMTDVEAARRIASDGIGVLVDLNGHMSGARLGIYAQRPAPVQIYWLGHGGGLGLSFIDYVIADNVVIPGCDNEKYCEKIIRMPESYHPADRHPISSEQTERSDYNLPEDAFVFCGFNATRKINSKVLDSWMRILKRVPGSILWLSKPYGSARSMNNLRNQAEKRGVDPGRLVFASRIKDKSTHLARHKLADLFLDTFSYTAATTALDALWAGLPIVTLYGPDFYSRICTSFLKNIGLDSNVCNTVSEYEDVAVMLASNRKVLQEMRRELGKNREIKPLFDTDRFVRHLDLALLGVWYRYLDGMRPEHLDITRLP